MEPPAGPGLTTRGTDAERLLAAIVDTTADAVLSKDLDARITSWNRGAERLYGYTVEEAMGRPVEMLIPDDRRGEERQILNMVLEGKAIETYETVRRRKDGSLVFVSLTASAIRDAQGEVVGVSVLARDITERRRAEEERRRLLESEQAARLIGERARERLSVLADAGRLVESSLDVNGTLHGIGHLAVPRLGELCVVDLLEPDGSIQGAFALVAADPQLGADLERLRGQYPIDPDGDHPVAEVLRSGEARLLPRMSDEFLEQIAQGDEHLEFMHRLRYQSALVAPLAARGRTFGALSILRFEGSLAYEPEDLELAEELARRAALAIDNGLLYRERTRIARTLQSSLLPPRLPAIPDAEVTARYRPGGEGDVGGDFYDVFETSDGWALVIGDVCGKGPEAAALTALARYTIRAAAVHRSEPRQILSLLNEAILRQQTGGRFCTAIYAVLERRDHGACLRLASGGHPPPLLISERGVARAVGESGTVLGVVPDPDLGDDEIRLEPGDTLVFYTDGLTDAQAPKRVLTHEDLLEIVTPWAGLDPVEVVERLEAAALGGQEDPRDDVALVALRLGTGEIASTDGAAAARTGRLPEAITTGTESVTMAIAGGPAAPGRSRRRVADWVARHASSDTAASARLLVSELVTNAVVHGGAGESATIEIHCSVDEDAVRVEVCNPGSGFMYEPAAPREPGDHVGRYGLYLVGQLADSWGVETGSPTRVWFELSNTAPRSAPRR